MGAAASSEAALKRTLIVALGPGASYGRLPQNPRQWTKEQCAIWLRQQEMGKVADIMLANDITGEMLLDEANEQDIAALVTFPPLRRKLMRGVAELRQRATDASARAPDMSAASLQIQASLDQLNETMKSLETTLAQEAAVAAGKPISTSSDADNALREASAPAARSGLVKDPGQRAETAPQDENLEAAAVKIQAVARGNMERKKGQQAKEPPKSEAEQGDEAGVEEDGVEEEEGAGGISANAMPEALPSHAGTGDRGGGPEETPPHQEDEAAEGIEEADGATSSNEQEAAATKIQAVTRGRKERGRLQREGDRAQVGDPDEGGDGEGG